jgi:hypothetical protein
VGSNHAGGAVPRGGERAGVAGGDALSALGCNARPKNPQAV